MCIDTPLARHLLIKVEQLRCIITRGFADIMEAQNKCNGQIELVMKSLGITTRLEDVVSDQTELPVDDVDTLIHFNSLLSNPDICQKMVMYPM